MITLFSNDCPRCKVLKAKLDAAKIEYNTVSSIDEMIALGFQEAPKLSVDGELYDFKDAINWIGEHNGN